MSVKRLMIGVMAAVLAFANPTVSQEAILALGQSNMRGSYGPSPSDGIYSPFIGAWKLSTDSFQAATLGVDPFVSGNPNNLAFVFAKEYTRRTERTARLVLLAADGVKLEYFLPTYVLTANNWINNQSSSLFGTSLADELLGAPPSAARQALSVIGKSRYDIVLIHQGEANAVAGDSAATYKAKLLALLQDMHSRGMIILGTTPILLGHINPSYPNAANHASAIESVAGMYNKVTTVPWSGISIVGGGNLHASGTGLEQLGIRYANAYFNLQ